MPGLPPLIEEDVQVLDASLDEFLTRSEASTVLIIDMGGPVISQRGTLDNFDSMTISALAAGAFSATQMIATQLGENNFSNIYQQGERVSLLFCTIDADVILVIIFNAEISVGSIKYYAATTVKQVAQQLDRARQRAPQEMVDLVSMNVVDAGSIFRQGSDPVIARKGPMTQPAEPGEYWWCSCGRSASQPFCDGSHEGTGFTPVKTTIEARKTVAWCGCKHSKNKPFCDGSHCDLK